MSKSIILHFKCLHAFILTIVFTSVCAVLSEKKLSKCGDCVDLENICKNLMELDISSNLFEDWNEVNYFLYIYLIDY